MSNTPTDWAAIISVIVTGVAAVTGIAGTYLQARSSQKATSRDLATSLEAQVGRLEDRNIAVQNRMIYAQKMRIYAAFRGAVDHLIAVADRGEQQEGEFSEAHSAMLRAAAEVELVAPDKVGELTRKIKNSLTGNSGSKGFRSDFDRRSMNTNLKELPIEMKLDLAEYELRPRHVLQ
jgi:hypothetical protein